MKAERNQMERKTRKRVWSDSAISALLIVWEQHLHELSRSKRNSQVMNDIHSELKGFGVVISIEEIRNKMKNMTQRYRSERRKAKDSPSNWVFFEKLDKFLAGFPFRKKKTIEESTLDGSNPGCSDAVPSSPENFSEDIKEEKPEDLDVMNPYCSYSNDTQSNSKDSSEPASIKNAPAVNPADIIRRLLFNQNPDKLEQEKKSDIDNDASVDHVSSDLLNAPRSKRELTEIHEDILAELVKFNANESKRLKLQMEFNDASLDLLEERNELERKRNDISERYLKHYQESNAILKRIIKKKKL